MKLPGRDLSPGVNTKTATVNGIEISEVKSVITILAGTDATTLDLDATQEQNQNPNTR
jgi:hypothetical protein